MNKGLYRLVFNAARGMVMVVGELAFRVTRSSPRGSNTLPVMSRTATCTLQARLTPLCCAVAMVLGGIVFSSHSYADIVADANAPANQQPAISTTANGTPQVNIQTPSRRGVSHNTYSQFDVDNKGVILNNSAAPLTPTQQAGLITGNANVANGPAAIILNEVNSADPSTLNGFIEVAGKRADVIVANPAGISCSGCGFINTKTGTLTTGSPVIEAGALEGFRVERGTVTIDGSGLDASTTDFTHIIARAVQVNAAVIAQDLKVTTGRNQVNASNTDITALDGEDDSSPTVSVDVSALGGMYAGKIALVGTEDGVGVRNAGEIGASVGEFTLTSDGRLQNSGSITAVTNLNLNTQDNIDNQGIIHSGQNTTLNSQGSIDNQGTVSAYNNTALNAQGDITQSEDGGLGAGIDANSNLINAGDHPAQPTLAVTAGADIHLQGNQVATTDIVLDADSITLESAAQQAQSITLTSPDGNVTVNNSQQTADAIRVNANTIAVTQSEQQATTIRHIANDTLDLSGSDILAADIAVTATNTVTTDNALLSSDTLTLDAGQHSNRNGQLLQNTHSQITTASLDNTDGRIHSNDSLSIDAAQLQNTQGDINSKGELNITANSRLDNTAGRIVTEANAELNTGTINNDQGLIQANQALTINTQNQPLTNTNAGSTGGIIAGTELRIDTGAGSINNDAGYLNGQTLTLNTQANVSNRNQGVIESQTQLTINANSVDNRDGQLQSGDDVTLNLDAGNLNNQAGLIRANNQLTVNAATINNTQTNTAANRGLEAATVTLRTDTLDNTQGRVIADNLILQAQNTVDNTNGLLSASQRLQLNGQGAGTATAQVNNSQGTVVAGQQLSLNSSRLLGAGDILSEGTSSITLDGDYTHISNFLANDSLSLTLSGSLTNQAVLGANGDLTITSASLDNALGSELSGTNTRLIITGTLSNYGLIDSRNVTGITAQQVDNIGTGRIYGNHIAIEADTLNNQANSDNTAAAVIAARNELDIGVTMLNNTSNALLYSEGNADIGGAIINDQATGQAGTINNESATLEAGGAINITAVMLNNLNPSFALDTETVVEDAIIEYQRRGSLIRYTPGPLVFVHNNGGDKLKRLSTNGSKDGEKADENFTEYRFTRTTTRDVVANTNPAAITAAGDITLTVDSVNNQASQIIAGAALTTTGERLASEEMAQQTVTEQGESITYSRRRRDRRRDAQRARRATYAPTPIVTAINLNATVYQENTDSTTGFTVAPSTVPATITGATAVNTASLSPRDAARIVEVDTDANSIRTVNLSPEVSNNSLFQQNPADTAAVLVETDPRFTNNQQFLSSDFVLLQLDFPESNQKRLGDGFYEQRLVREQMIELTGLRFLDNYTDEEQQYQDLLDNGIAFAQQHQLIPGVRLSDAQMQQLTDDMVWLETQTVSLRDGSTQTVLVPRLYAVVQPGDLYGTGALLSGRNVTLNSDQLVNSGSIIAREQVNFMGEQLRDTRGRLQANRISANTNGDITLAGSRWRARNQLDIDANNLTLSSTSHRTTLNTGHRDEAGTQTSLFVTGPTGSLSLHAQQNLNATGGEIINQGTGDTTLTAGNNLNLDAQVLTERYTQDGLSSTLQSTHSTQVKGGGDVTLRAGQALNGQGVDISAGNDLTLDGAIVALTTAENTRDERYKGSGYRSEQHSLTHDTANLQAGNNVSITSTGDLTLSGTDVTAGDDIVIHGEGDTTISAVQNEAYRFTQEKHKRSFGRSETRIDEQLDTTVVGGQLSGDNIAINTTFNDDGSVSRQRNSGNVVIDGAQLTASERIAVDGDDVKVIAQKETHLSRSETHKKGVGGLNNSSKGRINREQVLQQAELYSVEDLSLLSSGNVTVLGSQVVTDGSLNIEAVDDVIVSADEALSESKQWSKQTRFFSDIDSLYSREDRIEGNTQGTAIASTLSAGGDMAISASRATVIGSDLTAGNDLRVTTDVGDLKVLSVDEAIQHYQKETTVNVGLSDVVEQLTDIEGQLNNLTDVNNGQARVSIAKAQYDQVDTQTQSTQNRASQLNAGGNIALDAAGDLAIQGSDVTADTDGSGEGNVDLTAGGDILLTEAESITDTHTQETHGTAELSLVVQHQAVEVAKAARALETAKENIKDAKEDYRQYQKDLKALKRQRDQLQADYNNDTPGIAYEDIVELNSLIDEVASDEEWHQASIAFAVADAASKTTLLVQQTGAAKNSVATYGFNAGLQLDIDATTTDSASHQEQSYGTTINGQNIRLTTGDDTNRDSTRTLIQGSHLNAKENLTITTGNLDVVASQDTHSSQTDTEQQHIRIAQTVYGTAGGPTVSVDASRSRAKDSDTVHTNSTLQANTITLNTTNDATFNGATVHADDTLTLDVKGDLLVQSVQNRYSASHNSAGVSAGFSLGSGANAADNSKTLSGAAKNLGSTNGEVSSVNGGLNSSSGRERSKQTVLTSLTGGTVDITVDNHTTIVGATIAAVDDEGNDNGQLSFDTRTLDIVDLSNTAYTSQRSAGISTSVGIGDKPTDKAQVADPNQNQAVDANGKKALSLDSSHTVYNNSSTYTKSKTLATVGQGSITVRDDEASGEDSTQRLNRDIENTEKELYTVDRQQGDIDLTVDHRLLTEEGRKEIAGDVKSTQEFGEDIGRATSTLINDERASISRFWTNLEDNVKVTELKNLVVSDGQLNQLLKSSDPKENAEGKQQLVALAQRQLGLSPEQVSKLFFFDSKKVDQGSLADNNPYVDVKGATILDGEYQGRIGIDVGEKASDEDILNSLGHEAYEGATLANGEVNDDAQEALADAYGAQLSDRISQAIEETGGGDTSTSYNTVNTLEGSRVVTQGNEIAIAVGDAAVDYRQLQRVEVDWIATHAPQFAAEVCRSGRECITVEEAENRLTQQAFSRVQYGTGKRDTAANKFLRRGLGHLIPSDPDHAEAGPFSLFYATPEQRANINIYVNQAEDVIDAYQQAGIEQPSLQAILDDAKEHGEYSEQMAKNLIVGSLAIGGLVLAPIAASTATAAELAAFASNPVNYCLGNPIGCTIGAEEVALAVTGVAAPSSLVPSVVTKLDDVIEGVIRTGDDAAKAAIKTRVPEGNANSTAANTSVNNPSVTAPNLTDKGTLTNVRPNDPVVLQSKARTLVQDSSGRYWLEGANGNRITPSGSYDFVTLPSGQIRVARPNTNPEYSTHLGLSGGGDVNFAGSIRFGNNSGPNRGSITKWSNDSGHYQPPSGLADKAGLPTDAFNPR